MSWAPKVDPKPPTRRGGLTYWAWVWRIWAIGCALWASLVVALYAYGITHGVADDPGPFWVAVPLAYLLAFGCWRMSRYLFRRRDVTTD